MVSNAPAIANSHESLASDSPLCDEQMPSFFRVGFFAEVHAQQAGEEGTQHQSGYP
ncbi:hypothetical protein [Corynebacterium diphtheriae]|uniref:hypothetical protein n=1 Tax=Corynebacterium diphtheriae TaxID=1717 RepID=UPI0002E7283D|nr:hypothetical protein [Corynebacterium diphtheriae]